METYRVFRRRHRIAKDTYSGKLILRLDPETHKCVSEKAQDMGISMNLLLNMIIEEGLKDVK